MIHKTKANELANTQMIQSTYLEAGMFLHADQFRISPEVVGQRGQDVDGSGRLGGLQEREGAGVRNKGKGEGGCVKERFCMFALLAAWHRHSVAHCESPGGAKRRTEAG